MVIDTGGNGNIAILALTSSNLDFGGGLLKATGPTNMVLAGYHGDSTHAWSKIFPSSDPQVPRALAIALDASGSLFTNGDLKGTIDFGVSPLTAAAGAFFAKLDSSGGYVASRAVEGIHATGSLAVDCAGSVVVGSAAADSGKSTADFGGESLVQSALLAKLGPILVHVWSKGFGADSSTRIMDAATDRTGDVILVGQFRDSVDLGGELLVSAGDTDIFIARLSP
jgi:hypothetical protein